ncbi:hypothetical protein FA13DRAFT_1705203 [Coprinellus micaceus]|uniref:Uncharacterized protein n=1 Tax=Coprinellus micaceus TaxID=71717 RepID=A0A4Y7TXE0_COPMI|nr:hypothetical protein FA13DRAFT_1705203 [Coprinellus micaceus]
MGRPRLYSTDEECLAAGRERSHRYYHSNSDVICERRCLKYEKSKGAQGECKRAGGRRRRTAPLTEEERKLKNREKSAQHYQRFNIFQWQSLRKKSEVKSRRLNGHSNGHSSAIPSAPGPSFRAQWEGRLAQYMDRLPQLLGNQPSSRFLDKVVKDYLKDGVTSWFSAVCQPFDELLNSLYSLQGEILNRFGAGAETGKTGQTILEVKVVIGHLQDLEIYAMEHGQEGFTGAWMRCRLPYQRRAIQTTMAQPMNTPNPPRERPAVVITFAGEKDGQKGEWYLEFKSKEEYELYIYLVGAAQRRAEEEKQKESDTTSSTLSESTNLSGDQDGGSDTEYLPPDTIHVRKARPHPMAWEFQKVARERAKAHARAIRERKRVAREKLKKRSRYELRSGAVLSIAKRLRSAKKKSA